MFAGSAGRGNGRLLLSQSSFTGGLAGTANIAPSVRAKACDSATALAISGRFARSVSKDSKPKPVDEPLKLNGVTKNWVLCGAPTLRFVGIRVVCGAARMVSAALLAGRTPRVA